MKLFCDKCENSTNFTLVKEIAKYNPETEEWDESDAQNFIEYVICDNCDSVNVEEM